jgi:hypothetical protein
MFAVVLYGRILFRAASARRCHLWRARRLGRFSPACVVRI